MTIPLGTAHLTVPQSVVAGRNAAALNELRRKLRAHADETLDAALAKVRTT